MSYLCCLTRETDTAIGGSDSSVVADAPEVHTLGTATSLPLDPRKCSVRKLATMRKKVDSRIRTLVENCVKQKQRSLFVIVGDKGRDQVVNLHYMLSKTVVKARPSVLWCYKKELYLSRSVSSLVLAEHVDL